MTRDDWLEGQVVLDVWGIWTVEGSLVMPLEDISKFREHP
jgi:hypothetical protein